MVLQKKYSQRLGFLFIAAVLSACGQREPDDLLPKTTLPQPFPDPIKILKRVEFGGVPSLNAVVFDGSSGTLLASNTDSLGFSDVKDVDPMDLISDGGLSLVANSDLTWKEESRLKGSAEQITVGTKLFFRDTPVYGVQLKRHQDAHGQLSLTGRLPNFLIAPTANLEVGEFLSDPETVQANVSRSFGYALERFAKPEKQYLADGEKLRPVWLLRVKGGSDAPGPGPDVPMRILVDAETSAILSSKAVAFDMDGQASMYMENRVADNLQKTTVTLPDLLGTGSKLESNYWRVYNCQLQNPSTSVCSQQATGSSGNFSSYTADPLASTNYDELVSYHAVARSFAWNTSIMNENGVASSERKDSWGSTRSSLGFTTGTKLYLFVRAPTSSSSGSTNYSNAQYLPCGSGDNCSSSPWIVVGTGWEAGQSIPGTSNSGLRYLGKDADVVMHEFHHHVVFRALTSTDGETGAMHEGLADYFTYAITGNNLLGESIVPEDATSLRSGNLSGTMSAYSKSALHKKGEFWSSVLWDVRETLGVWKDGVYIADKIIWDAVDLCTESETFYGFISAMGKAADAFAAANGKDATALRVKIFTVFYERGFLTQPNSSGALPKATSYITGTTGSSGAASTSTSRRSRSSGSSGWCSVASNASSTAPWVNLMFLLSALCLPVTAVLKRTIEEARAKRALVKIRREEEPPTR